jgi:hypothetical protein
MAPTSKRTVRFLGLFAVAALLVAACGTNKKETDETTPGSTVAPVSCESTQEGGIPISYAQAADGGCEDDFDWGEHCDLETGKLEMPTSNPPDCVPAFEGDNGGATSTGVTADAIRVARYIPQPDPATEAFLRSIGAADEQSQVDETYDNYLEVFNALAETYGRRVEFVNVEASGGATDAVAARADALKVKDQGVFAVIGGPAQTRAFSEEISRQKIVCLGGCVAAQSMDFYKASAPYIWPGGPAPDQTAAMTTELIEKQLLGKPAEFTDDPELSQQERTFVMLTYDDGENNFRQVWEAWRADMEEKGIPILGRVVFTLDLARAQQDAQAVVQELKSLNATTIIFTGDPIMPSYFTEEMTAQGYFPEWLISGTVFADTTVLARGYDPDQWKHAFGISLIPARVPRELGDSSTLYRWWTGEEPPAENTSGIIAANMTLLYSGIHFAGPDLTPETFSAGLVARPIPERDGGHLRSTVTYGKDAFWPAGTDYAGLDDVAVIWWDPDAGGEDETGADGDGQYRYVNNGGRFRPGEIPTEPIGLFETEGSITYFSDEPDAPDGTQPVPDDLKTDIDRYPKPS